jgi:hypothetical protein
MIQGNICYRLVANTNYRPGATGATAGPQNGEMPISGVYVAPGAATLDFYDINGNRNQIAIGAANTGVFLPISVYQTGSSLSGTIFGFSAGNPYGNTVATGYVGPVS